jgi:serine/threonine protein kinase
MLERTITSSTDSPKPTRNQASTPGSEPSFGSADQLPPLPPILMAMPDLDVQVARQPAPASVLPNVPGYEILGELGRSGMGAVYQARQTQLGRIVALKMIRGARANQRRKRSGTRTTVLCRFATQPDGGSVAHPYLFRPCRPAGVRALKQRLHLLGHPDT